MRTTEDLVGEVLSRYCLTSLPPISRPWQSNLFHPVRVRGPQVSNSR